MAWEPRSLAGAGAPSGYQADGDELSSFRVHTDVGLEDDSSTGYYNKGSCQNPVPPLKTVQLGDVDACPTRWDDRAWTAEWLSLVEKPLLTPQDVATSERQLASLRHAFVRRHMRTCQILVQERTWSYSYKNLKPIVQTASYEMYVSNNACFKVQSDTGNRFGPDHDKITASMLNNELKAYSHAQRHSNTRISTPLCVLIDLWGGFAGRHTPATRRIRFSELEIQILWQINFSMLLTPKCYPTCADFWNPSF